MEEVVVPVVVMACLALVPIVKMLVSHQQKMTEIIHRQSQVAALPDTARLESEIRELKTVVHQQAIALDNLTAKINKSQETSIQQRLEVAP